MLRRIWLENFKSFKSLDLELGPLTVLVGTNASGKSNLRDAFRFLHGIGRGYTLPEIIGGKSGESEGRVWAGIRGGIRELIYQGPDVPTSDGTGLTTIGAEWTDQTGSTIAYQISIAVEGIHGVLKPRVDREVLEKDGKPLFVASSRPEDAGRSTGLRVEFPLTGAQYPGGFHTDQPLLDELVYRPDIPSPVWSTAREASFLLADSRFLDLSPDAMRLHATPAQRMLNDRGSNLSSVLQTIAQSQQGGEQLLAWLRELTPHDVEALDFTTDPEGRVLVQLVESSGRRLSARSASDGTLRFLGILAALFSPTNSGIYLLEEVETGIHPTRLHLLIQLMEQQARSDSLQLVVSTHSPLVLGFLSEETLRHTAFIYRGTVPYSVVRPLLDIPHIEEARSRSGVANLYESGWLEQVVELEKGDKH